MIVAKDDPAALQQLETAIGALRGIVSHVASNETLTKVAEDVRSLAAKVDTLASTAASGREPVGAREPHRNACQRADRFGRSRPRGAARTRKAALRADREARMGSAHPHRPRGAGASRRPHRDAGAALRRLRRASRPSRSDRARHRRSPGAYRSRFAARTATCARAAGAGRWRSSAIERDVAEIKQSEQRTQDSLEAVQGTVEHVVDRLAMIESGIRETRRLRRRRNRPQARRSLSWQRQHSARTKPPYCSRCRGLRRSPGQRRQPRTSRRRDLPRAQPIDPSLPPDHPLEPGSASGRSRPTASAADRIAASEAAVSSTKPPVIADPGEKPNFIAAARRAAQAAAAAPRQPPKQSRQSRSTAPNKIASRARAS